MSKTSATFRRAISRAQRKVVNRESSMVMAYIDDIVIATESGEDHMCRLREVFECLREAGCKMRVVNCDFMKSEIKYLGHVISAEGIKPDPKTVAKLRDWENPRNKTDMQSFWDSSIITESLFHCMSRRSRRCQPSLDSMQPLHGIPSSKKLSMNSRRAKSKQPR